MKKIITVLSAIALVIAVSGCASTKAEPKADDAAQSVACINNPDPTGTVDILDGFEEGNYWMAVAGNWGNSDKSVEAVDSTDWASEGSTSGLWTLNAPLAEEASTAGDKATFFTDSLLITDFTEYKSLYVDMKLDTDTTFDVCLVVQDTDWIWKQTVNQTIAKGENKNIAFDLTAMEIPNPSACHRVCFCFFTSEESPSDGTIYVDNIRLVK